MYGKYNKQGTSIVACIWDWYQNIQMQNRRCRFMACIVYPLVEGEIGRFRIAIHRDNMTKRTK